MRAQLGGDALRLLGLWYLALFLFVSLRICRAYDSILFHSALVFRDACFFIARYSSSHSLEYNIQNFKHLHEDDERFILGNRYVVSYKKKPLQKFIFVAFLNNPLPRCFLFLFFHLSS